MLDCLTYISLYTVEHDLVILSSANSEPHYTCHPVGNGITRVGFLQPEGSIILYCLRPEGLIGSHYAQHFSDLAIG